MGRDPQQDRWDEEKKHEAELRRLREWEEKRATEERIQREKEGWKPRS